MTEEEVAWVMPKPDIGCTVKVWPFGREDGKPHHAHVARVHDRSIDTNSPLGTVRGGVRFIGDPVLKNTSDENRKSWGAWDFTDETKLAQSNQAALQDLQARVQLLESLMAPSEQKKKS